MDEGLESGGGIDMLGRLILPSTVLVSLKRPFLLVLEGVGDVESKEWEVVRDVNRGGHGAALELLGSPSGYKGWVAAVVVSPELADRNGWTMGSSLVSALRSRLAVRDKEVSRAIIRFSRHPLPMHRSQYI